DVGDIDAMAKYSIEILKDIETLRGFKNRAYEKAADFDILKILPQYEELYKRALSL
ncbi:MAG: N-acetyl-alpha-D-glucosaminyl L-malate synthase BshA, partial [Flavobacteriaceae bacterium]|nr:N-acetyl-alpha-D-glucosaminyl L-malate synthase BshA [Flavobacteriaceae bacterium]